MIDGNRHKTREIKNLDNSSSDASVVYEKPENEIDKSQVSAEVSPPNVEVTPSGTKYKWYQLGPQLAIRGVRANFITMVGLSLAAITAFAIARGYFYIAIVLLTVGGLMDFLDGSVAKASNTASVRGAFLDSVIDRVSDALIFGGVTYYFLDSAHPKYAIVPLAILAVSQIISYERAKAETLGLDAKGGLMERAERLIFLGISMALHIIFLEMLAVLLLLCLVTAVGRFYKVWMQIPQVAGRSKKSEWRTPKVHSVWRSRRGAADTKEKDWYFNYYKTKRRTSMSQSTRLRMAQKRYGEPSFHFSHNSSSGVEKKRIKREKRNQK